MSYPSDGEGPAPFVEGAPADASTGVAFAGHAYTWPLRVLAGVLLAGAGVGLWFIAGAALFASENPVTPLRLMRLMLLLVAVPWAVACAVARSARATFTIADASLVLRTRRARIEVPLQSIARVTAWTVPLPGPGLTIRLRSGARLAWGIAVVDPSRLLEVLGAAPVPAVDAVARHPVLVWAHARSAAAPWRWYHYLLKFVAFGALPTAILFRAHQYIAYGGTFGEYYTYGLVPYLAGLAIYGITTVLYLVLWAAVLRGLAEAGCLLVAAVAPRHAARVRRYAEIGCAVGFYIGVPLLIGIRFSL
jgi:hypothetical protein